MGFKNIAKYTFRFLFLQSLITSLTIYYFDNFLLPKGICESCPEKSFRLQIDAYLVEDKNRFFSFLNDEFVKIDIYLAIFIFIFSNENAKLGKIKSNNDINFIYIMLILYKLILISVKFI